MGWEGERERERERERDRERERREGGTESGVRTTEKEGRWTNTDTH